MRCRVCGSDRNVKNGKRKGIQSYLCRSCGFQFTSESERHSEAEVNMAVSLYSVGLSYRTIAKMVCVSYQTIYRWIRDYAQEHYTKPLPKGEIIVELDEMHHFIQSKKTNYGFGKHIAEQLDSLLTGNAVTVRVKHSKEC